MTADIGDVVELGHCRIEPVGGHDVLGQIVGADGKERNLPGQRRRDQHGRRCLDHHTEVETRCEGHVFSTQFRQRILDQARVA
jgi:hypothetical protein